MKAKCLKMTADDVARLIIARHDATKGELGSHEKEKDESVLLAFAVDFATEHKVSTAVCDELIGRVLAAPPPRIHYAIRLAPRASPAMKEMIMSAMFERFVPHNIDRVISYAKDILKRDCTFAECEKMKHWFGACDNAFDKYGRQILIQYIAEHFPNEVEGIKKYFDREDQFWKGIGGVF